MTARWSFRRGEALAVLRSLPDASVDAVLTDPPYSSGGFTRGDRQQDTTSKYVQSGTLIERPDFAGDTRDQHSFRYWEALWMAECLRIVKPGSPLCVFTDWRQLAATTDALQAGGWIYRGILVWVSWCTFLSSSWNCCSVQGFSNFDTARCSASRARVAGKSSLPRSRPLASRITLCSRPS